MNAALTPGTSPRVSLLTAICIVIANMVGTGVFTSLGFQIGDLPSGFARALGGGGAFPLPWIYRGE